MDPITDIFKTLHVETVVQSRLEASAPWALMRDAGDAEVSATDRNGKKISPFQFAHVGMVSRGNCWLSVDGIENPIPLTGGDCFLIAPGISYILRDDPRSSPISFCQVAPKNGENVIRYGGGGAPTTVVSGSLRFETASLKPVTQLLPNLILIKADQAQTLALHTTMQLLASEMSEQSPGSEVVSHHLAEILFIQAIRAHIASGAESRTGGWLRAIFDPRIGAALRSVHENVNSPCPPRSDCRVPG